MAADTSFFVLRNKWRTGKLGIVTMVTEGMIDYFIAVTPVDTDN